MRLKPHIRILGIDDSPFDFRSRRALVVGVVARLPMYIEGIMRTEVEVDGRDANEAIAAMVERSRYREQLRRSVRRRRGRRLQRHRCRRTAQRVGIPCATVTREMPDFERMEAALRSHFPDWRTAWR